jgi:hypothetical protein
MHGGGGDPGPYSPSKVFGNVFIAFVGAGVLGLPYAFSQVRKEINSGTPLDVIEK